MIRFWVCKREKHFYWQLRDDKMSKYYIKATGEFYSSLEECMESIIEIMDMDINKSTPVEVGKSAGNITIPKIPKKKSPI